MRVVTWESLSEKQKLSAGMLRGFLLAFNLISDITDWEEVRTALADVAAGDRVVPGCEEPHIDGDEWKASDRPGMRSLQRAMREEAAQILSAVALLPFLEPPAET